MKEKHVYTRGGFVDLNTRDGNFVRDFPTEDLPIVHEVEAYLAHVAGVRNGKTLCPFTRAIFNTEGFRMALIKEPPSRMNLDEIGEEVGRELERVSPGPVGAGIPTDLKVVIAAFTHPECRNQEFAQRLRETHGRLRTSFLKRGQMFSAMYETHPDEPGNRGFSSSVPLLVGRRMHERDGVFMKTPEAKGIFSSFFPEADFGNPELPCICRKNAHGEVIERNPNCMKHGRR